MMRNNEPCLCGDPECGRCFPTATEEGHSRKPLTEIAVGDRVWVSNGHSDKRGKIQRIERLTPTQIILDGIRDYNRFQRGKPSRWSGDMLLYGRIGGYSSARIMEVATADECAEWDRAKTVEVEAERQEIAERERKESERQAMNALFPEHVAVSRGDKGDDWTVKFYNLTDEQVEQLAEFWRTIA